MFGAYVSLFAYAILSGGDYLDWRRLDRAAWLNRLDGLRTVVNGALQA